MTSRLENRLGRPGRAIAAVALLALVGACKTPPPPVKTPGCTSTSDCTGGLVCVASDGGDGQCQPCELDNQCQLIEICQPIDRRCELRHCFGRDCKLNADCQLGDFCVQGLCLDPRATDPNGCTVTTCEVPADCTDPADRCDTQNNVCVLNLGCTSDLDCPTGDSCNTVANICQQHCTADTAATVCGVRQQCSTDGRCVDCLSSADCGAGLTCDTSSNICQGANSCVSDRDCKIPLVCHPITKQCTVKPPPCSKDSDCGLDSFCYITDGFCIPRTCQPDALEPDDTFDTAAPLPVGETDNLTLCPNDVDYYKVPLVNGDHLDVSIDSPSGTLFPFQLTLEDPAQALIKSSSSFALDATVSQSGEYRLVAQSTDQYVLYSVRVSVTRGEPCQAGPGSPSATYLNARPVDLSGDNGVSLCPGDQDWFEINVPRGMRLTASISSTLSLGALDLFLYDSDGMTLLDSNTDIVAMKSVSSNAFTGTAPKAYIKVNADPSTKNVYDLSLTLGP